MVNSQNTLGYIFALITLFRFNTFTPSEAKDEVGEWAYWDADSNRLFWVSMKNTTILSYEPVSGLITCAKIDSNSSTLSFTVPIKDSEHQFVVGLDHFLGVVTWDGLSNVTLSYTTIMTLERDEQARLDYGKDDPYNRLWAGSMGLQFDTNPDRFYENKGNLYKVYHDGRTGRMKTKLRLTNGFDWSRNADKMYFVDSKTYKVCHYDLSRDGIIRNKTVLFDLTANGFVREMNSLTDSLTVDDEGMLWVGVYGTQTIIRIDPDNGTLISEWELPDSLEPTSMAFGGQYLESLYVTTYNADTSQEDSEEYPFAGKLVKIDDLGVQRMRPGTPIEIAINNN